MCVAPICAHRNCIVNAVVKNKIATARNERLGNATKRKTRQDVLDAMDLQVQSIYVPSIDYTSSL